MNHPRIGDRVVHKETNELVRVVEVDRGARACKVEFKDGHRDILCYPEHVEVYGPDAARQEPA